MLDCIKTYVEVENLMTGLYKNTKKLNLGEIVESDFNKSQKYFYLNYEKNKCVYQIYVELNSTVGNRVYLIISFGKEDSEGDIVTIKEERSFPVDVEEFNNYYDMLSFIVKALEIEKCEKTKISSINYSEEIMKIAKEISAWNPSRDDCFSQKELVKFANELLNENDLKGKVKYVDGKGKDWTDMLDIELDNNNSIKIWLELLGFDDDEDNALKATLTINGKADFFKVDSNLDYETYVSIMNKIFKTAKKGL